MKVKVFLNMSSVFKIIKAVNQVIKGNKKYLLDYFNNRII
ncbi:hypothetical protein DDD_3306 [Nonlabens dokdonensis DSW-6]|uniref:Uncharacterized protein n=1 Tax=Nonlabens dokdonensis (strain DSM 17205 / KCTC 12402 / DSW-6) TaxID=592029 RepID=L7WHH5_NONDD|nr:hypothetical protein DDD_3306 [Nonlabens dokdonensis DSW-6]